HEEAEDDEEAQQDGDPCGGLAHAALRKRAGGVRRPGILPHGAPSGQSATPPRRAAGRASAVRVGRAPTPGAVLHRLSRHRPPAYYSAAAGPTGPVAMKRVSRQELKDMADPQRTAVIVGAARTPIGRFMGGLSALQAPE